MNFTFVKGVIYQILKLVSLVPTYIKMKMNSDKYTLDDKFSVVREYSKSVLKVVGINLKVNGYENLPSKDKNVVFVANHGNWIDTYVLLSIMDRPSGMIAAKEANWDKAPLVKDWMEMINCLHIDRANNRNALKTINKASDILKNTSSIGVFPEGGVTLSDELKPFKDGAFRMAIKAQVPIVPIHIKNTKDTLKMTSRWTGKAYAKDVEVDILPAVYNHIEDNKIKTKDISEIVRNILIENQHKKEDKNIAYECNL